MTKRDELIALADGLSFAAQNIEGCLYSQRKMLNDASAALRLSALEAPAAGDGEPVAWVIPGDGNARDNGALDAMAWSEGEFTKPLYAAQPADAGMREAFVRVLASLAAAISILERTPKAKKAVASDKMFDQMLDDYRNALEIGRAAVRAAHGDEFAAEPPPSDPSSTRSEVTALTAVAKERQRQREVEGWTPAHDDGHDTGEMAGAAACYALSTIKHWAKDQVIKLIWPWADEWWKPKDTRRNLVKAGALIVAEIERLDRLEGPRP